MEKREVKLDENLCVPECYVRFFEKNQSNVKKNSDDAIEKKKDEKITIRVTKEKHKDVTIATFPGSIKRSPNELDKFRKYLKKKFSAGASYKENPLRISLSGNFPYELRDEIKEFFALPADFEIEIEEKKFQASEEFKVFIELTDQGVEVSWKQQGAPRDLEDKFKETIEKEWGKTYTNESTHKEAKFLIQDVSKEFIRSYFMSKYRMKFEQIEDGPISFPHEPKYNNDIILNDDSPLKEIDHKFKNPKNQYFYQMSRAILGLMENEKLRYENKSFKDNLTFTRKGANSSGRTTWISKINAWKAFPLSRVVSGRALSISDKVVVTYDRKEISGTITEIDSETGIVTAKFLIKTGQKPPGYKEGNDIEYDEEEEEDENEEKEKEKYENFLNENKIESEVATQEEEEQNESKEEERIGQIFEDTKLMLDDDDDDDDFKPTQMASDGDFTIHFEKSDSLYQKFATALCSLRTWDSEVKKIVVDPKYRGSDKSDIRLPPESTIVNLKESQYLTNDQKKDQTLMQKLEINPTSEQKKALEMILSNKVSIVHGGPGTGKTFALGLFVYHLLNKKREDEKHRILLCANNDQEVRNMVKFVAPIVNAMGKKIVWVSYENFENEDQLASVATEEEKALINYQIMKRKTFEAKNYQKLQKEKWIYNMTVNRVKRYNNGSGIPSFPSKKLKQMNELKLLIETNIVQESDVVCCTISTSAKYTIIHNKFNTVFIDDAQNSIEIQSIIPLIHLPEKLVLLGDSKQRQSPPLIKRNQKVVDDYPIPLRSLYKKLMRKRVPDQSLNIQFRINPNIFDFPNKEFYKNQIQTAFDVESKTNVDLSFVKTPIPNIMFVNMMNGNEKRRKDGTFINDQECYEVLKLVSNLRICLIPGKQVGVLSPFFSQVQKMNRLLSQLKYKGLKVSTIDDFQGEERDYIVISLVRTIGYDRTFFEPEKNLLNIALTRARKGLFIVGKYSLFSSSNWNKNTDLYNLCVFCQEKRSIVENDEIELLKHFVQKKASKPVIFNKPKSNVKPVNDDDVIYEDNQTFKQDDNQIFDQIEGGTNNNIDSDDSSRSDYDYDDNIDDFDDNVDDYDDNIDDYD